MGESIQFTMSRPVIFSEDRIYIIGYSSVEKGTRIFRWTGSWENYYVPFITAGIAVIREPEPEIVVLGVDGSVHSAGPEGQTLSKVSPDERPLHHGPLRDLVCISNDLWAVGIDRQVYHRPYGYSWARCDEQCVTPQEKNELVGFEAVDGFSNRDIYAAGHKGEIWHYNGLKWHTLASVTNVILSTATAGEDKLYIGGKRGTLLKGRGDNWEIIEQDIVTDDFWGSCWYKGSVWFSTVYGVYELKDDVLLDRTPPIKRNGAPIARYLASYHNFLYSVGEKSIAFYDGDIWNEIPLP